MSNMWNEIGGQSNPVSAKRKQATFVYVYGHYDASLNILASVESNKFLCQFTSATTNMAYIPRRITLENHFKKLLTPCVVFLPPEDEILPPCLRYQMFRVAGMSLPRKVTFGKERYAWVVVDAQVLLHFYVLSDHEKMKMTSPIEIDLKNMLRDIREESISHIFIYLFITKF